VNPKIFLCIAMGVFVAHLAGFMIYFRLTMDPKPPPPTPAPNFRIAEGVRIDAKTGIKTVTREITVSTKLAPPGTYQGRADQSVSE
jgi:hypothetical protein